VSEVTCSHQLSRLHQLSLLPSASCKRRAAQTSGGLAFVAIRLTCFVRRVQPLLVSHLETVGDTIHGLAPHDNACVICLVSLPVDESRRALASPAGSSARRSGGHRLAVRLRQERPTYLLVMYRHEQQSVWRTIGIRRVHCDLSKVVDVPGFVGKRRRAGGPVFEDRSLYHSPKSLPVGR
jgi:hypothetical protein